MNYVRLFAGPDGESHFEEVAVELAPVAQYAKGVPDAYLSASRACSGLTFLSAPTGWVGDWHPAPRRQFMVKLTGGFCDVNLGSAHNRPVCAVKTLTVVRPAISSEASRQSKIPPI
jgi:hypothetical protein